MMIPFATVQTGPRLPAETPRDTPLRAEGEAAFSDFHALAGQTAAEAELPPESEDELLLLDLDLVPEAATETEAEAPPVPGETGDTLVEIPPEVAVAQAETRPVVPVRKGWMPGEGPDPSTRTATLTAPEAGETAAKPAPQTRTDQPDQLATRESAQGPRATPPSDTPREAKVQPDRPSPPVEAPRRASLPETALGAALSKGTARSERAVERLEARFADVRPTLATARPAQPPGAAVAEAARTLTRPAETAARIAAGQRLLDLAAAVEERATAQADDVSALSAPRATNPAAVVQAVVATPDMARHVASQMAVALQRSADGTTELTLNPPELGRVRMTLGAQDGMMVVQIIAERAETGDMMRRHIEVLAQEFRALGYDHLSFSFGRDRDTGDRAAPSQQAADSAEAAEADLDIAFRTTRRHAGGALDLRL